ncbi:MAG: hypothetical protein Q9162_006820, partial [Coniocarpon cinnabarinum]
TPPPTTTTINGIPCTIAPAPSGGVVINNQTCYPSVPTTIAGQPINVIPGSNGPSVQIGTVTVPVPTIPAVPAKATPVTTTVAGVPCTVAPGPSGGAIVNETPVAPGVPTQVAGQPVAVVPGTGAAGPSVQIGTATVPVPTGGAGAVAGSSGSAPGAAAGSSGSAPGAAAGGSAPAPYVPPYVAGGSGSTGAAPSPSAHYTGAATANGVSSLGGVAALLLAVMRLL